MSSPVDADLPKSVVKRLVKAALDRLDQSEDDGKSLQLNKARRLAGALKVSDPKITHWPWRKKSAMLFMHSSYLDDCARS